MENQTEGDIVEAARFEEEPLTNLHPNHATVLRIQAVLFSLPFLVAALALEVRAPFWPGIIIGPVTILAFFAILRIPMRRHLARGYTMGNDRLRVVRGILFRHDAVVPFGRVQHIDVNQGPLERMFRFTCPALKKGWPERCAKKFARTSGVIRCERGFRTRRNQPGG
jgi:membrane protein YdbS with pleckstrin-like domain